jgi:hypothetical protein
MLKIFAESLPAPISRRHADFYGRQSTDFKTARRFLLPAKHRFQDGTAISTAGKAPNLCEIQMHFFSLKKPSFSQVRAHTHTGRQSSNGSDLETVTNYRLPRLLQRTEDLF